MFSWICPQCGKDVPPSKTDCPYCAERAKEFAATQVERGQPPLFQPQSGYGAAPPRPGFDAPQTAHFEPQSRIPDLPRSDPQQPQSPNPGYQAQTYPPQPYPPQTQGLPGPWPGQQYQQPHGQPPGQQHWGPPIQKSGPPTWLLSIAFALAILGVGAAVYFGVQRFSKSNPQERAGLENPSNPSKAKVENPLQKYIEVVGIRLMGDSKKKPIARFIVVNHSTGEIDGLTANVTLWASTSRSEEDSVASFSFKLPRLGPSDSKELTESLKTKLKLYELPDWQNANADVQITAP